MRLPSKSCFGGCYGTVGLAGKFTHAGHLVLYMISLVLKYSVVEAQLGQVARELRFIHKAQREIEETVASAARSGERGKIEHLLVGLEKSRVEVERACD